jgi:hypothetical protein
MTRLGLTVNEAKTTVRDARQGRFDFLGYSFGPHHYRKDGHWYSPCCTDPVRLAGGRQKLVGIGGLSRP